MIAGAILAAGASRRFGPAPKQLADLGGRPLLEHALAAATAASGIDRTLVILGASAGRVLERVDLCGAEPIICSRWREGQSAALRTAIGVLGDNCEAVVVTLGDQPFVSSLAIEQVVQASDGSADVVRATYDGVQSHPVLFNQRLFAEIRQLRGDRGARELLRRVAVSEVDCSGTGLPVDIDHPDDLAAAQRAWAQRKAAGGKPRSS